MDGTLIAEVKQGKDGASVKLMDRMKAMNWLTDHMDLATEEQRRPDRCPESEDKCRRR